MTAAPDPAGLPQEAYAAALADLPGIGPARLAGLLREDHPQSVWRRVEDGEVGRPPRSASLPGMGPRAAWAEVAKRTDVGRGWAAIRGAGIQVGYLGGPALPPALEDDPEPPGVLFWLGDLAPLGRACVAIVGTRHGTGYGRAVARELGRDLARCGVCVVSGLALGIDGAAHEGVLTADGTGPVGVAPSGVDIPYPRRHADLWHQVAERGAIISETPPGRPAQPWRFPSRNRLIAGLVRAVVVVESHAGGGSMLTVAAAAERGVDVLAVPGPVNSAASTGTNQLIHEGSSPVRHAGDVLAALGDFRPWPPTRPAPAEAVPASPVSAPAPERRGSGRAGIGARFQGAGGAGRIGATSGEGAGRPAPSPPPAHLSPAQQRVLDAIDRTPTATSTVADRTGLAIGPLSSVMLGLESRGLIRGAGMWWERDDQP